MDNTVAEELLSKGNNIIYDIGNFFAKCISFIINIYKNEAIGKYIVYIVYAWTIILLLIWLYIFIRYDLEHKAEIEKSDTLDFPDELPMEKIEFSLHDKITLKSFLATLSLLIYKRFFVLERLLIPGSQKEEYKLVKNTTNTIGNMTVEEENFQNKLLLAIGKQNEIPVTKFKNILKYRDDIEKLNQLFINYKLDAYSTIVPTDYYEIVNLSYSGIYAFVLIGVLLLIFSFKFNKYLLLLGILYALFIYYIYHVSKKTQKNMDTKAMWSLFKKNLNKMNKLKLKEMPRADTWLKYLSYSYVLGCEDKVYNMIMSKKPKTVGLDEDDLSEYFDLLTNTKNTLFEIKKAVMICEEKIK